MDYSINLTEQNLNDVLASAAKMPVVFHFISMHNPQSLEMNALLQRLVQEYAEQFLLATVNCDEQPLLTRQFGVQNVPTCYFFLDGQPVDMIAGVISEPELRVRLANILPREEDLKFNQALELLQDERFDQALPLLKSAWEMTDKKNSDIALLYAETYIAMKQTEPAFSILQQIPLQDRDSRWHGLNAQIELLQQASNSPELQQLQADYQATPSAEIAIRLANQLHQVARNEEALNLLFSWLKQDLNVANGEVKAQFLAILAALGQDPIVATFRRQLYSLLY